MLWFALLLPEPALAPFTRSLADETALAVLEGHPRRRVVAATARARARGILPGLGLAGALALAPDLLTCPRDVRQEQATLAELATWAGRFTPQVSLSLPDAVLLEASASLRLFGGAEALLQQLAAGCARLGLPCAVAAAPTPLAARWLARHRPGHLTEAAPGWPRQLDDLPLACLADGSPLPSGALELLQGLGLRHLSDLQRLPRAGLARRDAAAVLEILARARGDTPHPQPWFIPPPHYQARIPLPVPVQHTEPLLFAVARLVQGLCDWLAARHAGCDQLQLYLEPERGDAEVLTLTTGRATRSAERFQGLLREHLGRWQLRAPVAALSLQAAAARPLETHSGDLFGAPGQQREQSEQLLERLQARLGSAAIWSADCVAEHRPEHAWRRRPPDLGRPPGRTGTAPRPLWLLPQARPLGAHPALQLLHGPERIESGWWDGQDVRRDYYTARDADGALCWVYQELEPPQGWYLHGYFA